ncbi:MAG: hypothetical protein B7X86_16875 [Sphingobacteriales bacterium 17-39-43]|uniref:head GIN domain-containing protein n=1 Tax=Daejeonella sp. TaxID=2805397 RepID=UPI000BCCA850|nr:head GIN domain-containing protein [Daejeonella sp.]OYZ28288.1 MAG: hypothetical protein B7Y24_16890 [Sphingobacteriales bacterium 16-39-50]OZA22048.1 MAG: hypothetical protein B7X86_16875 [Sphingobacteriales bacterium 17-39-43]HQT24734.1 head GIN domain-containing protein [Daejeonella sp.]HQT57810.1 head GIN domain-containing protein [Daejeonella sp.]
MKHLRKFITLALFIAAGSELTVANTKGTVTDSKIINIDDERPVSGFSGITISGRHNVYITMGNTESLRLEGDATAINEIETKVEDGVLKIRNKKQMNTRSWNNTGKVNIYIQAKSLNNLVLSGSGNIEVNGKVKSANLSNTISGSGSITANIEVENYNAVISGSGEISAKGYAKNAKITIAGSGDFDGRNLKTSNSKAKVSGSGDISIIADKQLDAVVSGSGDIRYSGNAAVKSTKSGSGNISKGL